MELTAWMQMLALAGTDGRRWEPKRLRLRLLWIAGKLARRSRQTWLSLSKDAPWAALLTARATTPHQPGGAMRCWNRDDTSGVLYEATWGLGND